MLFAVFVELSVDCYSHELPVYCGLLVDYDSHCEHDYCYCSHELSECCGLCDGYEYCASNDYGYVSCGGVGAYHVRSIQKDSALSCSAQGECCSSGLLGCYNMLDALNHNNCDEKGHKTNRS